MTEHPFGKMMGGGNEEVYARRAAAEEAAFESRVAGYVLGHFGFDAAAKRGLARLYAERTGGQPRHTLAIFNEEYPTFPLLLGATTLGGVKLASDPRAFLPALFSRFADAPFVVAFQEFFEQDESRAAGRPLALVFPRKGIRHGLVIHNAEALEALLLRGTAITYHGGTKRQPHRLHVQPFQVVCEQIHRKGHGWRPGA